MKKKFICAKKVTKLPALTVQYKIYVRQEWARANDLTGTIKLSEYLMGIILLGPDIHTALKV